jgi:hypothetical protein
VVCVAFGDLTKWLDLRELAGDAPAIRLDRLWTAASLACPPSSLVFDFVGEDGFCPTLRGHPPLAADALARGYVRVRERRLEWDPRLALSCAYRVRAFARLVAVAA